MQDPVGVYIVETSGFEWNICGIRIKNLRHVTHPLASQLEMLRGNVDPGGHCAVLGKLQKVSPSPAADLKHSFAAMVTKLRCLIKPRVCRIALLFREKQRCLAPMFNRKPCGR